MIQAYKASNTTYTSNGDVVLSPTVCDIEAELNGAWELSIEHPIDSDGKWKNIENGAVISAPSFVPGAQLFRIYNTTESNDEITASARPIFMDSANDVFLLDNRPTNTTGQGALNSMLSGQTKYKGVSDVKTISTAYYVRKNLIEAISSNNDQSFLTRWGGEIWYDNYTINILNRIGGNYGVRAEFGHNVTGIESDIDMDSVVTRIVPESYNGHTLSGSNPWVDSPLIKNYPIIYTKTIKFDNVKLTEDCQEGETGFKTIADLQKELKKQCNLQFEAGIDKPSCNYKCDMVSLANTDEYKDVQVLESVGLGDTIHCKNKRIGIETDARAIKVKYDCIRERTVSVELGDFSYNYFNNMQSAANKIDGAIDDHGNLVAERIKGVIDGMTASLRVQNTVAKRTNSRAILFEDLDPNSALFGAMSIGTQGFEIAGERTADGKDWKWTTFGTAKGFMATYLIAGILSSTNYIDGKQGFCLNLDEGTIDSKNMKLDKNGILHLYSAIIEGGELMYTYTDVDGYPIPLFAVSENGVGIGDGAGMLTWYKGDQYMTLAGELQIDGGRLTGYKWYNGKRYKGIEMNNTNLDFYSWNDNGNFVGRIASTKYSNGRIGFSAVCDAGDIFTIGYMSDNIAKPIIEIDSNKGDSPPYIVGTVTGTIKCPFPANAGMTEWNYRCIDVKNGLITGWHTE